MCLKIWRYDLYFLLLLIVCSEELLKVCEFYLPCVITVENLVISLTHYIIRGPVFFICTLNDAHFQLELCCANMIVNV